MSFIEEDKANANGGRWLFTCSGQDTRLDDLWLETLLGMIGDCFSQDRFVRCSSFSHFTFIFFSDPQPLSQYITGCVVAIRTRGHKIALWLSEAKNETIIREIGRRWRSIMNLQSNLRIHFDMHNDNTGGGQQRPMYEE